MCIATKIVSSQPEWKKNDNKFILCRGKSTIEEKMQLHVIYTFIETYIFDESDERVGKWKECKNHSMRFDGSSLFIHLTHRYVQLDKTHWYIYVYVPIRIKILDNFILTMISIKKLQRSVTCVSFCSAFWMTVGVITIFNRWILYIWTADPRFVLFKGIMSLSIPLSERHHIFNFLKCILYATTQWTPIA